MAKLLGDSDNLLKTLLLGLVFLWMISQFVIFSNIGVEGAEIFQAPPDDFVNQAFVMLIVAGAVWLSWLVLGQLSGSFNRKKLVSFAIVGVVLYFIYTTVLVPLVGAPDLNLAAAGLQSMVGVI